MAQRFVKVATVQEIPPGRVKAVEVEGAPVAVCNVGGQFFAVENICTHDGGLLDQGELLGEVIECPRHGAQFDVRTGAVLALPAVKPLKTFPVRVEGDDILIGVA